MVGEEKMNLKKVLQSGSVMRYHNSQIDKKQTLDQHSWEVAVILQEIYPECSKELLVYSLVHDAAEMYAGDAPAPAKRSVRGLKALLDKVEKTYARDVLELPEPGFSDEEMLAVKYADVLSGIWFTTKRVNAGDTEAVHVRNTYLGYFCKLEHLNGNCDLTLFNIMGENHERK